MKAVTTPVVSQSPSAIPKSIQWQPWVLLQGAEFADLPPDYLDWDDDEAPAQ